MLRAVKNASAALAAGAFPTLVSAQSPLDVVIDGRAAAADTNMTEDGITALAESGGNVILMTAGLVGIAFAALAIIAIYTGHNDDDSRRVRQGWSMLAISGFITIPAIVAAIIPYMMGV